MRSFGSLSEKEILALAISQEDQVVLGGLLVFGAGLLIGSS